MWRFSQTGPSRFSGRSTAEEVTQGIDGTGLTDIVTGASSGIGTETARVLALRGVHVVMGVRNMSAGMVVKETITKDIPTAKIDAMELDLSSIASVRNFTADFNSSGLPLNILINNAGVMATPFTFSKDNIELQFATNHLGKSLQFDESHLTQKTYLNYKERREIAAATLGMTIKEYEDFRDKKIVERCKVLLRNLGEWARKFWS